MSNLLLLDGAALIKLWAMGFFVFHLNGLIHVLPLLAIFAFVMRFLYKKSLLIHR